MQAEKSKQTPATEEDINKLFADLTSNIYGIFLLLSLSCIMLMVHLYLAFFFHNR